jgi:membrane protease YdiL (CAAX protease family)
MSSVPSIASRVPGSSLRRGLARYPLAAFFALAFAGSWLVELPAVLGPSGLALLPFPTSFVPFFVLMPFTGPTLAALLVTALLDGRAGVKRLLGRYIQWRGIGWWYLAVLFGPFALLLAGAAALAGAAPLVALAAQPGLILSYLAALPLTFILGGPLGEEPGWRGFALPRLQQRFGALRGSLALGSLHALWHLPLFLVAGAYAPLTFASFTQFAIVVIFNAVIWAWVFNRTQASLLAIMLIHAAVNTSGGIVEQLLPATTAKDWIPMLAFGGAALALAIATRGRLAYVPGQLVSPGVTLNDAPVPVKLPA